MSVSVCLCMCVCPRSYLWSHTSDLHQTFVHLTHGRGLGSSSGVVVICYVFPVFMDDVMFAHKPRLLDVAAQLAINCSQ